MVQIFFNVIAPIVLIAALGFVADRRFSLNTRSLSQVVVYLAAPALVYSSISRSTIQAYELNQLFLFTGLTMVSMAVLSGGLARLLHLEKKQASAFALSNTLINAGNFGLPFISFAFGDDGLARAVIIFTGTSIVANTLGVYLASRGSASIVKSFVNMFKVPLLYAVVLGLLVNQHVFCSPVPIDRSMSLLGAAAVPLMLIVLGAQLARTRIDNQIRLVALASGTKLLLPPMIGVLLARMLLLHGLTANVAIIQTSMPTAVISIILAEEFGSDTRFVSSVVMVSTLGSFISLSLLLTWLR